MKQAISIKDYTLWLLNEKFQQEVEPEDVILNIGKKDEKIIRY